MSGVFVTGTDTACGKTSFATALARAARDAGLRVRVCKPVETGCEASGGERRPRTRSSSPLQQAIPALPRTFGRLSSSRWWTASSSTPDE